MEPTLHGCSGCNDDHVLVDKVSYRAHPPRPGDIVVFDRPPGDPAGEDELIKRVIGVPGETITLRDGHVYVNGLLLDEPYVNKKCGSDPTRPLTGVFRWHIPDGEVFVLGDNRCDSLDSRAFGPIRNLVDRRPGVRDHLAAEPDADAVATPRPAYGAASAGMSVARHRVSAMTGSTETYLVEPTTPEPRLEPRSDVHSEARSEPTLWSLSPSRAADFKACPLLYRFRCIDRLPESPSPVAVRGTLVHAVLESLFDLPAGERTLAAAHDLMPQALGAAARGAPRARRSCSPTMSKAPDSSDWLASARGLLGNYFDARGPDRVRAGVARVAGGVRRRRRAAARHHRPHRRLAGRRGAGRRLQDRLLARRVVRGQGAVPDEVLRAGAVARCAASCRASCG